MRVVKLLLKPFWLLTGPIRRPIVRRFDARVVRLVAGSVHTHVLPEVTEPLNLALRRLERIETSIAQVDRTALGMSEEVDLVLNGVSREIFRLQAQLEHLQTTLARDARMASGHFAIIDQAGDDTPILRGSIGDRSRVG